MTTLTLAADPATGSVRLTITPTADVTRVRRTDANGTADVRTMTGQLPHTAPAVLVLDDYEANGTARYTVTTTAGTVTGSIILTLASPWLGTPENPQYSAAVASVLDYGAGGISRATVHEPDGDDAPIVIGLGGSTRRGSLRVSTPGGTYAEALSLFRILGRGQTMLLRQAEHPGMDMYFIAGNYEIVTALAGGSGSVFDVTASYIEVVRPAGALSGALGWTWAALAAAFPTWAAVEEAYATWGDLRVDRRKA